MSGYFFSGRLSGGIAWCFLHYIKIAIPDDIFQISSPVTDASFCDFCYLQQVLCYLNSCELGLSLGSHFKSSGIETIICAALHL
jgi:hypothetical protein